MNQNEAILEKLKKLLRMKRGGTPDEIATALRLAQKLAEDNGIDLSQVDPDATPFRPIGHESTNLKSRIQWEEKYSAMICDAFFNVSAFTHQKLGGSCITFVGSEVDRKIAIYVYHFLVGHFRREWNRRSGRLRNRQAFMYGMHIGVCSKLRERQPPSLPSDSLPSDSLSVALANQETARADYIRSTIGTLSTHSPKPDGNATAALNSGYTAGRNTEIRQGLETSRAVAMIG